MLYDAGVYSNEEQVQASHSGAREWRLMRSGVKGHGCVIVRHASLCSAAFDPDITDGEMWESESPGKMLKHTLIVSLFHLHALICM